MTYLLQENLNLLIRMPTTRAILRTETTMGKINKNTPLDSTNTKAGLKKAGRMGTESSLSWAITAIKAT